jgi:hypothetical protein
MAVAEARAGHSAEFMIDWARAVVRTANTRTALTETIAKYMSPEERAEAEAERAKALERSAEQREQFARARAEADRTAARFGGALQ